MQLGGKGKFLIFLLKLIFLWPLAHIFFFKIDQCVILNSICYEYTFICCGKVHLDIINKNEEFVICIMLNGEIYSFVC